MNKIAIIIPTYNEKDNIKELIEKIAYLKLDSYQIFFIDDNSPDNTADLIEEYKINFPITLIKRNRKLGLGSAYILGFNKAIKEGFNLIIEMDADLSHNPEDIPRLIKAAQDGADLSIGSRKVSGGKIIGWNLWRHLMSNGAMLASKIFLKLPYKDITSGFRCYKADIFKKVELKNIKSNGYAFQEEMLFRVNKANFKVIEIPVTFIDRKKGKSKLSKKDIIEFFKLMIKLH